MGVSKLGITDIGEAVADGVIPTMAQLRHPDEGLSVVHLLLNDS